MTMYPYPDGDGTPPDLNNRPVTVVTLVMERDTIILLINWIYILL